MNNPNQPTVPASPAPSAPVSPTPGSPTPRPAFDPLTADPIPPRSTSGEAKAEAAQAKVHKSNKTTVRFVEMGILVLGVLLALVLRWGVYETAIVTSGSMENTLQIQDHVLVDHRITLHGTWQRGDIVFFRTPPTWGDDGTGSDILVKRVIGLPGDIIEIRDGAVYVNDHKLNEPYLKEKMVMDPVGPLPPVPQGEYWVMGDNRNKSDDSRYNGPVPEEYITGRGLRVLWPLGDAVSLSRPDYGF